MALSTYYSFEWRLRCKCCELKEEYYKAWEDLSKLASQTWAPKFEIFDQTKGSIDLDPICYMMWPPLASQNEDRLVFLMQEFPSVPHTIPIDTLPSSKMISRLVVVLWSSACVSPFHGLNSWGRWLLAIRRRGRVSQIRCSLTGSSQPVWQVNDIIRDAFEDRKALSHDS
jgi:hypothetical protein